MLFAKRNTQRAEGQPVQIRIFRQKDQFGIERGQISGLRSAMYLYSLFEGETYDQVTDPGITGQALDVGAALDELSEAELTIASDNMRSSNQCCGATSTMIFSLPPSR